MTNTKHRFSPIIISVLTTLLGIAVFSTSTVYGKSTIREVYLKMDEDTIPTYEKVTLPYARFHTSQSWRNGSADYLCFDNPNPTICPDSSSIGGVRRYLKPIGEDSFDIEMNIYTPLHSENTPRPTIIFIHGSGLVPNNPEYKDSETVEENVEGFTDKGYNFVSIDYRKGWEAHYIDLPDRILNIFYCFFNACSQDGDSDDALEHSYSLALFRSAQDLLATHRYLHYHAIDLNIDAK